MRRRFMSRHSRGQVLIITSGVLVALIAAIGLVIDLGWYQVNALRVQRAADAAALAGVVFLPNQAISAYATARAEAVKNDYDDLDPIDVVTPIQDAGNPRRLNVTIQTQIDTFFIRVIGFNTLPVTADGERGVCPAGADGQPAELLRHWLPGHAGCGQRPAVRYIGQLEQQQRRAQCHHREHRYWATRAEPIAQPGLLGGFVHQGRRQPQR